MIDTNSVLKKAAEKARLSRVRYKEKNIPTSLEDIVIFPFFGDTRSSFILSSLLMRRAREELKSSKYFVVASWPGHEGIYPYADEYWQHEDESALEKLRSEIYEFENRSSVLTTTIRILNECFYDVMTFSDLRQYYNNGLTNDFFQRFKHIKLSLPSIPSTAVLGSDLSRMLGQRENKIFLYPSKEIYSWKYGSTQKVKVPREFWKNLFSFLVDNDYFPIVYADTFSYDMSSETTSDCLHVKNLELTKVFGLMRSCGCVLDIFNGISRYALAARTPFICLDERQRFNGVKEYEINDLCGNNLPKEYIFGFSNIIENGDESIWKSNIYDHLLIKIKDVYKHMNRDLWPSPAESNDIVPYDNVRKIKNKKLGSRFIKIEKV
jgi:hypothetical protein